MSRETWMPLAILIVVGLVIGGAWSWISRENAVVRETEREARAREREAHQVDEMRTESAALLRDVLPGVELGTDLEAVHAVRPTIAPSDSRVDSGLELYDERLENGAQAIYAFSARSHRLERVQVLSTFEGIDGIAPHLAALHDRYGTPTGIWDCTDEGGIRTRRFTWRGSHLGLADVVLLYGSRVSLTLYVTTNEQMARSLQRAGCVPTPPDQIDHFPTAAPAQIERARIEDEGVRPR
jgi:hypothetical protein